MRIFITGATGFIGEQLAEALLARNDEVVALVRSPEKAAGIAAAGAELVHGDLDNETALKKGMKKCDAVFHLAAFAGVWPEDKQFIRKINVAGTRAVLEAARKNKVPKVIFTSTAGVFGPSVSADDLVDEKTVRKLPFFNEYEASKAEAEAVAKDFAAEGLQVVIVNPARVYGPGRHSESNAMLKLISLYKSGKWHFLPGNGKQTGSYCFIDDVVAGHIKAMEHGRSGENYLLGGENATYRQLFRLLGLLTGKQQALYKLPVPFLILGSYLMKSWAKITKTKPLITPGWAKRYSYNWSVSSRKAIDELGYTITPLKQGLRKTIR